MSARPKPSATFDRLRAARAVDERVTAEQYRRAEFAAPQTIGEAVAAMLWRPSDGYEFPAADGYEYQVPAEGGAELAVVAALATTCVCCGCEQLRGAACVACGAAFTFTWTES